MPTMLRVRAGDPVTAADYNAIAEALERFSNLNVADGSYLRLWDFLDGKHVALHPPVEKLALLSGSASPYSFQEVDEDASGVFVARTVGDSCSSCVYEVNGVAGVGGAGQEGVWAETGDWRFQFVGFACKWAFSISGCNATAMAGALVNLSQSGSLIATCTTDGSGQCTVSVPAGTYEVEVVPSAANYATHTSTKLHLC